MEKNFFSEEKLGEEKEKTSSKSRKKIKISKKFKSAINIKNPFYPIKNQRKSVRFAGTPPGAPQFNYF